MSVRGSRAAATALSIDEEQLKNTIEKLDNFLGPVAGRVDRFSDRSLQRRVADILKSEPEAAPYTSRLGAIASPPRPYGTSRQKPKADTYKVLARIAEQYRDHLDRIQTMVDAGRRPSSDEEIQKLNNYFSAIYDTAIELENYYAYPPVVSRLRERYGVIKNEGEKLGNPYFTPASIRTEEDKAYFNSLADFLPAAGAEVSPSVGAPAGDTVEKAVTELTIPEATEFFVRAGMSEQDAKENIDAMVESGVELTRDNLINVLENAGLETAAEVDATGEPVEIPKRFELLRPMPSRPVEDTTPEGPPAESGGASGGPGYDPDSVDVTDAAKPTAAAAEPAVDALDEEDIPNDGPPEQQVGADETREDFKTFKASKKFIYRETMNKLFKSPAEMLKFMKYCKATSEWKMASQGNAQQLRSRYNQLLANSGRLGVMNVLTPDSTEEFIRNALFSLFAMNKKVFNECGPCCCNDKDREQGYPMAAAPAPPADQTFAGKRVAVIIDAQSLGLNINVMQLKKLLEGGIAGDGKAAGEPMASEPMGDGADSSVAGDAGVEETKTRGGARATGSKGYDGPRRRRRWISGKYVDGQWVPGRWVMSDGLEYGRTLMQQERTLGRYGVEQALDPMVQKEEKPEVVNGMILMHRQRKIATLDIPLTAPENNVVAAGENKFMNQILNANKVDELPGYISASTDGRARRVRFQ